MKKFINQYPKLKQWLWFVGLWIVGVLAVFVLTLPIKLLVMNLK